MSNPDKTFLTIAIPTYNRPREIQRQVRILLPQLILGKTRLIVYDNASPTPVETLFTDEEKSLFEIHRNSVNIGGDANIAHCFEACSNSEWGYVPGDDDELFPDTISRILKQIENYPNAIFINFGCENDEILNSEYEYLQSLAKDICSFGNALWISKGVYHTSMLSACYTELYQYGYSFASQVIFILTYLKQNKNGIVIRRTTPLFEKSVPGDWDSFIFSQRLMVFYTFYDNKRNEHKKFLQMITRLQLRNVFWETRKRTGLIPSPRTVKSLLKQILCFNSTIHCLLIAPLLFLNACSYILSPSSNRLLVDYLYKKRKRV